MYYYCVNCGEEIQASRQFIDMKKCPNCEIKHHWTGGRSPKRFYIWAVNYSFSELKKFWKPERNGYTVNLDKAGIYNQADIKKLGFPIADSGFMNDLEYQEHNHVAIRANELDLLGNIIKGVLN